MYECLLYLECEMIFNQFDSSFDKHFTREVLEPLFDHSYFENRFELAISIDFTSLSVYFNYSNHFVCYMF